MLRFHVKCFNGIFPRFSLPSLWMLWMLWMLILVLLPVDTINAKDIDAFQPWLDDESPKQRNEIGRDHTPDTISGGDIRSCIEEKASLLYFKKFILLLFNRKDLYVREGGGMVSKERIFLFLSS